MYQGTELGYIRHYDNEELEINTWKKISTIFDIKGISENISIHIRPISYGGMLLTDYITVDNIIFYDLSVLYGIGQEPSIEEFERDLQIFKDRVGEPSYGGGGGGSDDTGGGGISHYGGTGGSGIVIIKYSTSNISS